MLALTIDAVVLYARTRRAAGIGLFALTVAVTPANLCMWFNPALFPQVTEVVLA